MLRNTQVSDSVKAHVAMLVGLAGKNLEGVEQLATLNLQLSKTLLAEGAQRAYAAIEARGPVELMSQQVEMVQALPAKVTAYSRQVKDIVASVADAYRAAAEARAAEFQTSFFELMNGALKNVPGNEQAVALVKSTIETAKTAYASANKASEQVSDAVVENLTKAAETRQDVDA